MPSVTSVLNIKIASHFQNRRRFVAEVHHFVYFWSCNRDHMDHIVSLMLLQVKNNSSHVLSGASFFVSLSASRYSSQERRPDDVINWLANQILPRRQLWPLRQVTSHNKTCDVPSAKQPLSKRLGPVPGTLFRPDYGRYRFPFSSLLPCSSVPACTSWKRVCTKQINEWIKNFVWRIKTSTQNLACSQRQFSTKLHSDAMEKHRTCLNSMILIWVHQQHISHQGPKQRAEQFKK